MELPTIDINDAILIAQQARTIQKLENLVVQYEQENNQLKTQLEKHLEAQCQEESIPQPEEPHGL